MWTFKPCHLFSLGALKSTALLLNYVGSIEHCYQYGELLGKIFWLFIFQFIVDVDLIA